VFKQIVVGTERALINDDDMGGVIAKTN